MSAESLAILEAQAYQYIISTDEGSLDLALREIQKVDAKASVEVEFAPGILLINGTLNFAEIAEKWLEKPPIFIRHICPVQGVLYVDGGEDWHELLKLAVSSDVFPYLSPDLPFSVQSRIFPHQSIKPFEVNQVVSEVGIDQFGLTLEVRQPEQVVSITVRSDEDQPPVFYIGASLTIHNLSDWAGGMRRFAREEGQISRSEFKLLEAIDLFGLQLPARGSALDLGASPGGWTRILRGFEQYVTAVDPGDLDPRLANDRGIRYKRMTAEAYLDSDPDPFDIIVNDMRMDGRDSARLMTSYARLLYPHGWALMTVKLPEVGRETILEHTFGILRNAYRVAGARQLFHNRSEITVWLLPQKRRSEG